jgi:hypothetical protein
MSRYSVVSSKAPMRGIRVFRKEMSLPSLERDRLRLHRDVLRVFGRSLASRDTAEAAGNGGERSGTGGRALFPDEQSRVRCACGLVCPAARGRLAL